MVTEVFGNCTLSDIAIISGPEIVSRCPDPRGINRKILQIVCADPPILKIFKEILAGLDFRPCLGNVGFEKSENWSTYPKGTDAA